MPNEEPNPINLKLDQGWDKPEFKKLEIETRVKELVKLSSDALPAHCRLLVDATYEFPKDKRPSQLGIMNRRGLITRLHYASPFKGTLQPGDIILQVNNTIVSFNEKTVTANDEEKPGSQRGKVGAPKTEKMEKTAVAASPIHPDFKRTVTKILQSKTEPKITITVARLKTRHSIGPKPEFKAAPGFKTELAYLYQFKHLKLGLNMQQTDNRIVVNYTTPDTVSHITLNIGEAILAVDEKMVNSLDDIRQRIMYGCSTNGFAQLIVEYPINDPAKNLVRGQLTKASQNTDRPLYQLCGDVRKYCDEGIEALKNGKELGPIFKENDKDEKIESKGTPTKKKKESVDFRKRTEEILIPAEWNSKLFVLLPPLKTKDTEMRTDCSVMIKK